MGLFDDDFLEELLNEDEFPPYVTELNEGSVQAMFLKCLATKETTEYLKSILYQKEWGHTEDSAAILFDKKKLIDNIKSIRYLYGQLLTTHKHSNTISTSVENVHNSMINYKGQIWTNKKDILMQFFHLGVVTNIIYPFSPRGNSGFKDVNIPSTLSPKDPNFNQWWEDHKVEWEGR